MRKELGCTQLKRELPIGLRRIDIVGLKGREIIAVELKLRDWRGALGQAWRNRVCSHWSYVALPYVVASHIATEEFKRYGIGVWAVRGSRITVASEPELSPCLEPFLATVMQSMRS
jgi:hypothetical protein